MQVTQNYASTSPAAAGRVRARGKFFECAQAKWLLKGLTYGPFAPNAQGAFLPSQPQMNADFAHAQQLGANCLRVYHKPSVEVLDLALEHDLRVFIDIPWDKHRCFFEDWSAMQNARRSVRQAALELGQHPALFAISVANEISSDIVRFYGQQRVAGFLDQLLDTVRQEAPDCLTTFANYPSTEFLHPERWDFLCFNVYLEQPDVLGRYLDRLQHIAGSKPLILGEYGCDSIRHGEAAQAAMIQQHVARVFHHGLAGSFVFSYTDDWYTGGHQIEDWAFGITRPDRAEKPAASVLASTWAKAPRIDPTPRPRVSVVVCSYNGASTLRECLDSLTRLNYPDYEVILVDDGSGDDTPSIARDFPTVRNIRQENQGLSVARNVGAQAATGEIVAYTDSDCVADPDWLHYLMDAMHRQGVDAIGGPNIPPPSDGWTAQCVAASPGGPSHVMLDDQLAEHVPGCNMAFRRSMLLELGGFDAQFRQAGDDVDICWRVLEAGYQIGYAAGAVVWHHRRTSVKAFFKQQKGYGRSEAMLLYKHPHRFNNRGCSRWQGVIYGEGAVGLPRTQPTVFHGRYGSSLFQTIYRQNHYSRWAYCTLLEWHLIAVLALALGLLWPPLAVLAGIMWALTLAAAWKSTSESPLSDAAPAWCRPLVFGLHILQPIIRATHRYLYRLGRKSLPPGHNAGDCTLQLKRTSFAARDAFWNSNDGRGREELLEAIELHANQLGWQGRFHEAWRGWDILLLGDRWHSLVLHSATENLGGPKRFTRVRCIAEPTRLTRTVNGLSLLMVVVALLQMRWSYAVAAGIWLIAWGTCQWLSRQRCFTAVASLLEIAGNAAKLEPFTAPARPKPPQQAVARRRPPEPITDVEQPDITQLNLAQRMD